MSQIQVRLEYTAQLKRAAGGAAETVLLPAGGTLRTACTEAARGRGGEFERLLLTDAGEVQPTLLVFHCDQPVPPGADPVLRDGDTVTIMTPISGG